MIIPVILCGGVGSRLWPLSRKSNPKQFIKISGENHNSLLEETVERISDKEIFDDPIILCNKDYEFKIREILAKKAISPKKIILEPEGRNTAPAIAAACFLAAEKENEDKSLLILPADHYIEDFFKFKANLVDISRLAQSKIITFGIKPTHPSTAYGYIKQGQEYGSNIFDAEEFVEKPNKDLAEKYLSSGMYFWNSGIFLLNTKIYLENLKEFEPEIYNNTLLAVKNGSDLGYTFKLENKSFGANKDISIDYAVLEKSKEILLSPTQINWSDVGSWSAVYEIAKKDEEENAIIGDVVAINSNNNLVYSDDMLTTLVGVKDLVVVSTKDAVLVANKNDSEKVKDIVKNLKENERKESDEHLKIYRPWGFYEDINKGKSFRTKQITVNPKSSLSLQSHEHRSEHWVVVEGQAEVTKGDNVLTLKTGESIFIPAKEKHRIANKTDKLLVIIEVQTGSYLGEDDITRYEDIYGRSDGSLNS